MIGAAGLLANLARSGGMDKSVKEAKREAKRREQEITSMMNRCRELDELFTKTYEDICCKGRLSKSSNTVRAAGSSVAV